MVVRGKPAARRSTTARKPATTARRSASTTKKPAASTRKAAPAKRPAAKAKPAPDVTVYADKEPTGYHKAFANWIVKEVGYDPNSASSKRAAFLAGVSIATAARPVFQNSEFLEEWREKTGEAKRGPKPKTAEQARRAKREVVSDDEFEDDENDFEDETDEEDEEFDEDESDEFDEDDEADEDDEEDEDDEGDEDDFEDEEEEEAPPTRTTRRAPAKKAPARKAPAKRSTRGNKPADDDEDLF